ncbi:hypothetical protein [Kordiimonas sp. SCSIO 12610]|uniref:hypothetical protein n=1 Tax=Kordiimonas sp. SCSIO 12610 TaxID=2829597 RepID=UPI00210C0A96|nr:hypothetical protein [Kordiimonas sp. SCSIO 12610]UTW56397.1 hypothetical protein KFF44_05695 [Kordiimonas sp. SCSIO 12610]
MLLDKGWGAMKLSFTEIVFINFIMIFTAFASPVKSNDVAIEINSEIKGTVTYSKKILKNINSLNTLENKKYNKNYKKISYLNHEIFDDINDFEFSIVLNRLIEENLKARNIAFANYHVEIKKIMIDHYPVAYFSSGSGFSTEFEFPGMARISGASYIKAKAKLLDKNGDILFNRKIKVTLRSYDKKDFEKYGYDKDTNEAAKLLCAYLANKIGKKIAEEYDTQINK